MFNTLQVIVILTYIIAALFSRVRAKPILESLQMLSDISQNTDEIKKKVKVVVDLSIYSFSFNFISFAVEVFSLAICFKWWAFIMACLLFILLISSFTALKKWLKTYRNVLKL